MAPRTRIECVNKTRETGPPVVAERRGRGCYRRWVARRRRLPEGAIEDLELRFSAAA